MCGFNHAHKSVTDSVHCFTAVQHHNVIIFFCRNTHIQQFWCRSVALVFKWCLCVRICVCVCYESYLTADRKTGLVVGNNAIPRHTHRRNWKPDTHILKCKCKPFHTTVWAVFRPVAPAYIPQQWQSNTCLRVGLRATLDVEKDMLTQSFILPEVMRISSQCVTTAWSMSADTFKTSQLKDGDCLLFEKV